MTILTSAIQRRMMDRLDAVLGVAGPAPRSAGVTLMSRLAMASVLRLALRWPALSIFLVVSVVAARLLTRRSGEIIRGPAPEAGEARDQPARL